MNYELRREVSQGLKIIAPPSDNDNIKSRKLKAAKLLKRPYNRIHELWHERVEPDFYEVTEIRKLTRQEQRDEKITRELDKLANLVSLLSQADPEFHRLHIDALRDKITSARDSLSPQGEEEVK